MRTHVHYPVITFAERWVSECGTSSHGLDTLTRAFCQVQTSNQGEADALTTINRLAATVDLDLATVETRGKYSLTERPVNDFIKTNKDLASKYTPIYIFQSFT